MQFDLAVNARYCVPVPARLRGRAISRAAYMPPLQATGPCAANTKTTPAKLRRGGVKTPPYGFTEIANKIVNTNSRQVVGAACRPPVQFYLAANARCCVPVPAPYGFTEIANKIVNTNSRQVVGAACRPPAQFYLAVNARCRIPVPAPCRAGS